MEPLKMEDMRSVYFVVRCVASSAHQFEGSDCRLTQRPDVRARPCEHDVAKHLPEEQVCDVAPDTEQTLPREPLRRRTSRSVAGASRGGPGRLTSSTCPSAGLRRSRCWSQ